MDLFLPRLRHAKINRSRLALQHPSYSPTTSIQSPLYLPDFPNTPSNIILSVLFIVGLPLSARLNRHANLIASTSHSHLRLFLVPPFLRLTMFFILLQVLLKATSLRLFPAVSPSSSLWISRPPPPILPSSSSTVSGQLDTAALKFEGRHLLIKTTS
ncbi:hypothetical protein BDZ97DRAFT_1393505 [Flammula alnicola]|nr:hypothetical protein BDZ97DRAFT_1393505 [Flammula alnicola]